MNDELYSRLLGAGVAEAEAKEIAKGFPAADANAADVDIDKLTKAMENIRDTFEGDTDVETQYTDDSDDLHKALTEANGVIDVVTQGADAILQEVRTQNDLLAKGLLALGAEVKALRGHLDTNRGELAKSLTAVQEKLDEPIVKSIGAEAIRAPGDAEEGVSTQGLIQKALKEMSTTTDSNRLAHLGTAVARLESFADPAEVAREYSL